MQSPLDTLVNNVLGSVVIYDRSGDHTRHRGGAQDDCIRCRLVAALPPWAQRELEKSA